MSPTDAFINGQVDDRIGIRFGDPDTEEVRRFGLLTKGALELLGNWTIPMAWTAPDNVENGFLAYRDPRVPEWDWWRAMAFQHEQRVTLSARTTDQSNQLQSVGKPRGRELTYLSNHSQLGGFCREGIRAGRDLWQAWGFAAEGSPEGEAYHLGPYTWEWRDRVDVNPERWWDWWEVAVAERMWAALSPTDYARGIALVRGEIWPFGQPMHIPWLKVPGTPTARGSVLEKLGETFK